MIEGGGKIIGLGATTNYISFGYCVDDALKEKFPVRVYHDEIFEAPCINYQGERVTVRTYAHDMSRVVHPDMPVWFQKYVSAEACRDLMVRGMRFFRADAPKLFAEMMRLAERDIVATHDPSFGSRTFRHWRSFDELPLEHTPDRQAVFRRLSRRVSRPALLALGSPNSLTL